MDGVGIACSLRPGESRTPARRTWRRTPPADPCPAAAPAFRYDQGVIELRSRDEIEAMRPAGRFVAAVLTELAERTRVGINVMELDRIAHAMIREHRAKSCYIDYHPSFGAMPFGKVL